MLKIKRFKRLAPSWEMGSTNLEAQSVRDRAFHDFEYFVDYFFSHHTPFAKSKLHKDLCDAEAVPDRRGTLEVIEAPRGNAKTTYSTLFKVIHAICYEYHRFIIVVGYSRDEANQKVVDIREELLNNEKLHEVFGKLVRDNAASSHFTTRNGVKVVARSRGGQIRGLKFRQHRPSFIILDDVESIESTNTPEQRDKTKQWFNKDVMGAGAVDGSTCVRIVGTRIHMESLLADLSTTPGWDSKRYKAIINFSEHPELWDNWREIYSDLDKGKQAQIDAKEYFKANEAAMLKGTEVLWPEGEPYYKLQEYIIKYGKASFYSEKQNEPYDPDKQILNPDICEKFEVIWPDHASWPTGHGNPKDGYIIRRKDKNDIHSNQLKTIAFHDPALTEEKENDYAAIVVAAQDGYGNVYCLDDWVKRADYTRQIDAAYALYKKWKPSTMYLETVGFQKLLKPLFKEAETRYGFKMDIVSVNQHKNKVHRISTMEPYFSNGWLKFNVKTSALLLDQLRLFPTTHDDGPDALQGCVERFKRPTGEITTAKEGTLLR